MAKKRVFSIRDGKLGIFTPPFNYEHPGQALRAFDGVVKNSETMISKYPSDFSLYELGSFDEETGLFENLQQHHMLASGDQFKKDEVRE